FFCVSFSLPIDNNQCLPVHSSVPSFPTRRSSDLSTTQRLIVHRSHVQSSGAVGPFKVQSADFRGSAEYLHEQALDFEQFELMARSEEHTSELQSRFDLVCRLLLE